MIDPQLLAILRCPATGQRLREAPAAWVEGVNRAIAEGGLYDVGQRRVETPLEGALVTEDQTLLYPLRGEIPTLIPDWGIRCSDLSIGDDPGGGAG